MKHVAILTASIEEKDGKHVVSCLEVPGLQVAADDEESAIALAKSSAIGRLSDHVRRVTLEESPVLYEPERQQEPDGATFDKDIGAALERAIKTGEPSTIPVDEKNEDEHDDNEAGTPE